MATTVRNEAAELRERLERGFETIERLCSGKLRWEMRVPAEPDHDPDLILADALRAGLDALTMLADERRATVERINKAYRASEVPDGPETFYQGIDAASANLFAALDEETNR